MLESERKRRWEQANPEKVREAKRRYYTADPEKVKERSADWRRANPEEAREHKARWQQANPEKRREAQRRRRKQIRDEVFDHYGQSCACCGTTERLSIDHVNGGGRAHRIELFGHPGGSSVFYGWLIANGFPLGYQVLCRPCNASKASGPVCCLDHVGS